MNELIADFLLTGAFLGIVGALSPGPLMALILSETLRSGAKAGMKVAITPLLTDIPFVIIAMAISKGIEVFPALLGLISIAGGCFLAFLAYQNVSVRSEVFQPSTQKKSYSLLKGITVNLLNPYPYFFWFSAAIPIFARGNTVGSITFAASLLISAPLIMIGLAILTAVLRTRLTGYLPWIVRALGILLFFYACGLIYTGVQSLT